MTYKEYRAAHMAARLAARAARRNERAARAARKYCDQQYLRLGFIAPAGRDPAGLEFAGMPYWLPS